MSKVADTLRLSSVVALRHWAIFRRDFLANVSPTLVDPFLFVVVFGYWLGPQVASYEGKTYLAFMAPGIAAMAALFTSFFEGSYGFYVRLELEGVFKALLTTPVEPKEILLGEILWLAAKGAIMATVVSMVLLVLQVIHGSYIYLVPVIGILTGVSCGAIGLISACYVHNINQFQTVYAWVISPMFFMSGMFVPTSLMPKWVHWLCQLSPFYHGVRLAQATLWAEDVVRAWRVHGAALLVFSFVLVYWASRLIIPRLRR